MIDTTVLQKKVLDEAFRGRLVRNLVDGIPYSKEIGVEKSNEKGIYVIPDNWEWLPIGEIGEVIGGGTPKSDIKNWEPGDIPWVTPADLSNLKTTFIKGGNRCISKQGLNSSSARLLPKNSVLFSSRAPIGYVAIAENSLATNQGMKSVVLKNSESMFYVYFALKYFTPAIVEAASGTTFKEISASGLKKIKLPLPPLEEQKRIVAKIEELFAKIDEIDKAQKELKELAELAEKKVLNMAVRGELVEQDENDNGVEDLLSSLAIQKERRISSKKMRRDKEYPPIKTELAPFPIPQNWRWLRLCDLAEFKKGPFGSKLKKDSFVPYSVDSIKVYEQQNANVI